MAEFKVDKALVDEISALRDSGDLLNAGYQNISSDDISTLETAVSIISQHANIKSLLDLYKTLVLRDAQDLEDLVEEATEMDVAISAMSNT